MLVKLHSIAPSDWCYWWSFERGDDVQTRKFCGEKKKKLQTIYVYSGYWLLLLRLKLVCSLFLFENYRLPNTYKKGNCWIVTWACRISVTCVSKTLLVYESS